MAGKALAAFSLIATLLHVRAQINCYPNYLCGQDHAIPYEVSSAEDCCLKSTSGALSYAPTDGSATCQPCYVIGFDQDGVLSISEDSAHLVEVDLHIVRPNGISDHTLSITFKPSQILSTATIGVDYTLDGFDQSTWTLSQLVGTTSSFSISIQIVNDDIPGEVEQFVLEIISAQATPTNADPLNVFVNNSLTVVIVDDDVINVQFGITEFHVDEEDIEREITFTIFNPIIVDVYLIVLALTYQQYDDQFPNLKAKYPTLTPSTLTNEYDQAELTDFTSRGLPFVIQANTTKPVEAVIVTVVDDNNLEPIEEGFRLVIIVNETMTPISQVAFGQIGYSRQVALFRIDDRKDEFQFGFVNEVLRITETVGSRDFDLPLAIRDGDTTEILMEVPFTDMGSNATEGKDYRSFGSSALRIYPPRSILPSPNWEIAVRSIDIVQIEQKLIVVNIDVPILVLPKPFDPVNELKTLESKISLPSTDRIKLILPKTIIIIQSGVSVGFIKDQYLYQENDGQATVGVVLTGEIATDVVVTISGGSSTQTNIGPERVVYNGISVTFAANGPKELNVSTQIVNDNIALEANEIVTLGLTVVSPASEVTVSVYQSTVITIVDEDSVSVHFAQSRVQVNESNEMFQICVVKSSMTILNLTLDLIHHDGSAFAGSDYNLVVSTVTIPADHFQACFSVDIFNDNAVEKTENFFVDLGYSGSGKVSLVAPSTIEVLVFAEASTAPTPPSLALPHSSTALHALPLTSTTCTLPPSSVTIIITSVSGVAIFTIVITAINIIFTCLLLKRRKNVSTPSLVHVDQQQVIDMKECNTYDIVDQQQVIKMKQCSAYSQVQKVCDLPHEIVEATAYEELPAES